MTDDTRQTDSNRTGLDPAVQRRAVRDRYASIATDSGTGSTSTDESCRGTTGESNCCGDPAVETRAGDGDTGSSTALGYSEDDRQAVADGADLGLGCGNPTAIAGLSEGETVLDLGSGAGFDCFLAAREVGAAGRVLGVDMTPEMIEKARANAVENDATNVQFRLGEIEHLPVPDAAVDVIVSNCVINLSPDKPQVFREAFRVLRPGGRLAIADVVLTAEPPADLQVDPDSVAACVAGASSVPALEAMLETAGFTGISIEPKDGSESFIREWDDEYDPSDFVVSATIEGTKPAK